MSDFELGADTYRIGKLNAFQQFHLSRKVAPMIPTLIPVFLKLQASAKAAPAEGASNSALAPLSGDLGALAEMLQPFADGIADMPDETAEFILSTCLGVVQRKQGAAWFPVWSSSQNTCMFDDLDLGVMMKLAVRVITESLGPFLRGMLTGQSTPKG
ncbi:phage tail assembly chaperone [Pseudomonas chlororaphis]|uniref:phage tail assembly chaperone n=1 Tax=Pseudomonas chlororaphis TaxID=587753 RepID=UPI003C1DC73D